MKKFLSSITYVSAFLLLFIALASCSGSGSNSAGGGAMGLLSIGLTDHPADYAAIYVTIDKIQVKQDLGDGANSWMTIINLDQPGQSKTFNLLDLRNGVRKDLGIAELDPGHYNQMRLILGTDPDDLDNEFGDPHLYANYLILEGEETQIELKVPSGYQTGIKLVNGFDIESSEYTDILLDFEAHKSVVQAGNSGKWLLKPTVKVTEVNNSVSGTVDTIVAESPSPLVEVTISAQSYNPDTDDVTDNVTEIAGALSALNGEIADYFMYLPINLTGNPYNIVATKDGYVPECQVLDSDQSKEHTVNFTMNQAVESGTLTGTIENVDNGYGVNLSIRQEHEHCGMIEIKLLQFVSDGSSITYGPIDLPAEVELYDIVASLYDGDVLIDEMVEYGVEIPATTITEKNFDFGL